jgi:lysophospholipase L1-like esterase
MLHRRSLLALLAAGIVLALGACASAPASSVTRDTSPHWVGTWGAAETVPAPDDPGYKNQTLRLIARATLGGDRVRVRISNTFGTRPLTIGAASIALQSEGATLDADSVRMLTFGGQASVVIPPAAVILSDAVELTVPSRRNLAVSLHLPGETGPATVHPLALQTSFVSGEGNFVANATAEPFKQTLRAWPFLSGIEVQASERARTIVTLGDSITDGYGATTDANHRWPDYLIARLHAANADVAVVNQGISGNRILHDAMGPRPVFGPNALSRFDRNVLAVSGATHVIVLIGINDIGMGNPDRSPGEVVSAERIIVGLGQLATRAHAQGLKILFGTLTPFKGAGYYTEQGEAKRQAVNAWIRSATEIDGFIDFDAATRDPANPLQFLPAYDSGDHLHPSDAGYEAMAKSIDLKLLQ